MLKMEKNTSKRLKKVSLSSRPCDFDHNGECLICDCWISECGYARLLNNDYRYENLDELLEMFKDYLPEAFLKSKKFGI